MTLITKSLPELYNGVSQQNPNARLDSQCELQDNMEGTIVSGLTQRAHTDHVAELVTPELTNPPHPVASPSVSSRLQAGDPVHFYQRDANEKYAIFFTSDDDYPIEVYDLADGSSKEVFYEDNDARDYARKRDGLGGLPGGNPSIRATTIADYTIVANNDLNTAMSGTLSPSNNPYALIWIKQRQANINIRVKFTNTALDADVTSNATGDTGVAAAALAGTINSDGNYDASVIHPRSSVIRATRSGGSSDFEVTSGDDFGNQMVVVVKDAVNKFTDLPPHANDGDVIQLRGGDDNYQGVYFEWNESANKWQETIGFDLETTFDAQTMPHQLVRNADGTFTFSRIDWSERTVGDDDSNPIPSFVGKPIKDIFLHKDRLGFISGENTVMGRIGDYFNFFGATATEILDDDPIDIPAYSGSIVNLLDAIPFNDSLLLTSEFQQFILNTQGSPLSPLTASIDVTTEFEARDVRMVGAGNNVYFVSPKGSYNDMYEYFVNEDTANKDAAQITAHVPQFLPPSVSQLASSTSQKIILALNEEERNKVYVYRYLWNGNQKIQSSWSTWTFDYNILAAEWIDSIAFFIVEKDGVISLESLDVDDPNTGTLNFPVNLDRLASVLGVYNDPGSPLGTTTWTLPYSDSNLEDIQVVTSDNGMRLNATPHDTDPNKVIVFGDYSSASHWVGKKYQGRYRFSEWVAKDQTGKPRSGYLNIKFCRVKYLESGTFELEVRAQNRDPLITVSGGLESNISLIENPNRISKERKFMVAGKSINTTIDITTSSYLPINIESIELQGSLYGRGRV